MLVFLYGSDGYRLSQARTGIVEEYKKKYSSGVNIFYFDITENNNSGELVNVLKSTSFFNEHKLAVINGGFVKKTTAEDLVGILKNNDLKDAPEATFLFVETGSEKELKTKHEGLFKILSGNGNIIKIFEPLDGPKLAQWTQKEIESRGCSINHDALRKLVNLSYGDSWTLINEIQKLTAYKKEGMITSADVELLVFQKIDLNIFDLIDAIGVNNRPKAFELLYRELKNDRDPYYILTMMAYQFRNLLMIKDLQKQGYSETEIAKRTKLHPFVVKKSIRSGFDLSEITKIYGNLLAMDTGFKAGRINLEDSLYKFVTG